MSLFSSSFGKKAKPSPADSESMAYSSEPDTSEFELFDESDEARPVEPTPMRPTLRFMVSHAAHWIGLAFGAGLSPYAPGTMGTLWAWVLYNMLLSQLAPTTIGVVILVSTLIGWWACTVTALHLSVQDPSAVVWDEVVAFWLVLWIVPAGFWNQFIAFVLFRIFDAAKPDPVAWADGLFKHRRRRALQFDKWNGFGILLDDFVAAFCALMVIALWRRLGGA